MEIEEGRLAGSEEHRLLDCSLGGEGNLHPIGAHRQFPAITGPAGANSLVRSVKHLDSGIFIKSNDHQFADRAVSQLGTIGRDWAGARNLKSFEARVTRFECRIELRTSRDIDAFRPVFKAWRLDLNPVDRRGQFPQQRNFERRDLFLLAFPVCCAVVVCPDAGGSRRRSRFGLDEDPDLILWLCIEARELE